MAGEASRGTVDRVSTVLRVVRDDITTLAVDAIVNAANSSLLGGGGVDGAIHAAGGLEILEACRAIVETSGSCATGHAVVTTAGRLPSQWVIHTVGPIWSGEDPEGQSAQLASCYTSSLDLAVAQAARTIAFPNISTGVYGFPKGRAAAVAVEAVQGWVARHPSALDAVLFACFDDENERLYRALVGT